MIEVTLALAILMGAGFAAAKLGQLIRLPSVTGYICAGLVLGPSGLNMITGADIGDKLDHFTDIALMLIAFGIGEHLELKRLKTMAKSVGYIGMGETMGAFVFVSVGTYFAAQLSPIGGSAWGAMDFMILALLLGAVSVATAPAATLHVMRELKAAGPLTTTLMAVVAVDDGLAIMIFGITVSAAHHFVGIGTGSIGAAIVGSFADIGASLLMGGVTGLMIDFVIQRLKRRGEMLTIGLVLLLLCGEGARLMNFSPLLAGMAAGFIIVNRDRRDVRLFRALNDFEPPIYVLFFTLAGAHLYFSALTIAGWVSLVYFFLRALGKLTGCSIGARLADAPQTVVRYLGLALVPQAGVAIGLIFLIKGDAILGSYSAIIIPVVLGGVVLSELIGPLCARFAVKAAGEAFDGEEVQEAERQKDRGRHDVVQMEEAQLVPWRWEKLNPHQNPDGVVVFGVSHSGSGPGLARMATLFAHHYGGLPQGVRVLPPAAGEKTQKPDNDTQTLFTELRKEVGSLGYEVDTKVIINENVSDGILAAAHARKTWAIVLGHPLGVSMHEFKYVVDTVARDAPCPVIIVRFAGVLHTERILVPVIDTDELNILSGVIHALSGVGEHVITLLSMVQPDAFEEEIEEAEGILREWVEKERLASSVRCQAVATEARLGAIVDETCRHDLVVMAATHTRGLRRLFFGSVAEDVAQCCQRPMLIVYGYGN